MKPSLVVNFGRALAACLLASAFAAAQERPAAPKPPAPAAAPARLVVEVEYFKGAQPAFYPVPGVGWFGHFATASPRRDGADTVQAVDVKTRLAEGGRVEIAVGVHLGEKHFDRFEEAGKYYASAGETLSAGGLARFGVAPFAFRVLRVNSADAAAPAIVNLTQSVEATVADFEPAPLPRGKLVLRNLSSKRVRAVYVRQVVAGRNRSVGFVMLREGKTLMEAGGAAEKPFVARTGASAGDDFTPAAVESIVVATVVFEDYTFEGEAEPAWTKRALSEGERAQLPRLLALLRAAQAAPDVEAADAPRRLAEKLSALRDEAPPATVESVRSVEPQGETAETNRSKTVIEVSMHGTRRDLINDLERFEKGPTSAPAARGFGQWIAEQQARFEGWLARL